MKKGREQIDNKWCSGMYSAIMVTNKSGPAAEWCFEKFGRQTQHEIGYIGKWANPQSGNKFLFAAKADRDYFIEEWK